VPTRLKRYYGAQDLHYGEKGIGERTGQWAWSSFRSYACGERGPVRVNFQEWKLAIKPRSRETLI